MSVYLDNVIVCGMVRRDLDPREMAAVRQIELAAKSGKLTVVTSREAWREQVRTQDSPLRSSFEQSRPNVAVVRDDHRMLGSTPKYDNHGNWYGNSPLLTEIVDESLFSGLKAAGLKEADARHYMYAVHNGCNRFLTTDCHFLDRQSQLLSLGRGIRVQPPSDLVLELGNTTP
jgi:hypothetical protein